MVEAKPGAACSKIPTVISGTIHWAAVRGSSTVATGSRLPASFVSPKASPASCVMAVQLRIASRLNTDFTLFLPWFLAISATTT